MSDRENVPKYAGCENDSKPGVIGRNTHDALVILGIVNNGRMKLVAGGIGMHSNLMLLPRNETELDENDCKMGVMSITDTATSLNMITNSVIAG